MTVLDIRQDLRKDDRGESRSVTRQDAMFFYAGGRSPTGLRASAADSLIVDDIAARSGQDSAAMRGLMLALADGIEQVIAKGLTPEQCYHARTEQVHPVPPAERG